MSQAARSLWAEFLAFLIAQCAAGAPAAAAAVGRFPIRRSSTLELVSSEEEVP